MSMLTESIATLRYHHLLCQMRASHNWCAPAGISPGVTRVPDEGVWACLSDFVLVFDAGSPCHFRASPSERMASKTVELTCGRRCRSAR
eukprot:1922133-Rhodomonas_salina.1